MYCSKCGRQVDDQAKFCPGCGAPMTAQSVNKAGNETAEQDDFFAKPEQAGNHDEFFTNYSAPAPGYTAPGAAPANQWSAPNTWAPGNPPQQAASEEKNSLALAGFICAFFIPLLGWIFGGIGLSRAKRYGGNGKGFAIAAIVVATVMAIVNLIVYMTILPEYIDLLEKMSAGILPLLPL